MANENTNLTLDVALAATAREEQSALMATVAWVAVVMDKALGWNGTPVKGGKTVVIKGLREVHGYRKDKEGNAVLDAKGNRVKRTSVFRHLARADSLLGYIIKSHQDWIKVLNEAALSGDATRFESALEDVATFLAEVAGSGTADAVDYFLKHGKRKPEATPEADATPADPVAALTGDAEGPAVGDAAPSPTMVDKVLKLLTGPKARLEEFTDGQLQEIAKAVSAEVARRVREAEERKAA